MGLAGRAVRVRLGAKHSRSSPGVGWWARHVRSLHKVTEDLVLGPSDAGYNVVHVAEFDLLAADDSVIFDRSAADVARRHAWGCARRRARDR